ncbi:MAG: hypothetical protein HC887_10870, partial [Desulfobacteraceae bacterium]|nr:hypothetical protein [Desulfobacteraceae bacterium]
MEAIYEAFTNNGMEFIDGGVRYSKKELQILSGENWFYDILEDILRTFEGSENAEVVFFGGSDSFSSPELLGKLREIRQAGIAMRS